MKQSPFDQAKAVIRLLAGAYPENNKTELNYRSPFELLVATILSAQSTDKQVNKITGKLFKKYNRPGDFASMSPIELESLIKGCGLYRNKSRNIIKTSKILVTEYNGRVPETLSDLIKLPGIGRKSANVILAVVFGKPVIPVDTHIFRVARRLGLARGNSPEKVEKELLEVIPPGERIDFHHRLIAHGRKVCRARNPLCAHCPLAGVCTGHLQQITDF